jgi:hypothetical protein
VARILISTSSLTPSHVLDLRTINDKMVNLVEHAEDILKRADEVFPSARSSWLRKIKAALGLLAIKDGQTLEDTIAFCTRLTAKSFDSSSVFIEPSLNIVVWAKRKGYDLYSGKSKVTKVGSLKSLSVVYENTQVGRLEKRAGKKWEFIEADLTDKTSKEFT